VVAGAAGPAPWTGLGGDVTAPPWA
jgi:hypothetical protein